MNAWGKGVLLSVWSVSVIGLWMSIAFAQPMIADITADVETEFGTYRPYEVSIQPHVEPYTVNPDFSNVVNFNRFAFSETDRTLLNENYFVVVPSPFLQIYDVYNECEASETPVFVTTDAVLHTFHVLYDYVLRTAELRKFVEDMNSLSQTLLAEAEALYNEATHPDVKEAALLNVAYFAVANVLVDSLSVVPADVDSLVQAELSLIAEHQGYVPSPLFGFPEDYSQYAPRGHYTGSEALQRYFRAMMWYGRMSFSIAEKRSTLGALFIIRALHTLHIRNERALDVWERVYDPTVFFVGRMDDLNVYQYASLARRIYGADFFTLPDTYLADNTLLSAFISAADSLPNPLITTEAPKGFRFMGQRFVPDSYILDRLTFYPQRLMPFGLDVMAVLGSERACHLLDEVYHQMEIGGYASNLNRLKREYDSLQESVWAQNLYWNWLYCLMPLLFPKDEGYPPFMQNQAWQDKEVCTALGSWAELRHDTILYVKQSMTPIGPPPPPPPFARGYVEPNPHLYARLAALARFMRIGLEDRALLFGECEDKLMRLESLLLFLKMVSEKELSNRQLTIAEYEYLCNFGGIIEELVTFPPEGNDQFKKDKSDEMMAVIADVHTDPNSGRCLEEGVGFPLEIYVLVEVEGEIRVTRGAVFSYYEFTQPIAERLTDEAWRDMQTSSNPKPMPLWTATFIDTAQSFNNPYPFHAFSNPNGVAAPLKGDVNGDGRLDVQDVMSAVNIIIGHFRPNTSEFWAADWNEDGGVNVLDIVGMIQYILNEEPRHHFENLPQESFGSIVPHLIQGGDLS